MNDLPVQDIRVIELGSGIAGPHCGRILASLGAEVIKIELPPKGDWSRQVGPFLPGTDENECSALYLHNNTGKKSVLLDWHTNEGWQTLLELVSSADVLIEDWDLEVRENMHLDRDYFTSRCPSLIDICVTPFGLSGPYSRFKSTPIVQLALAGYLYLIGDPEMEPLMLPGNQPDYLTALNANNAVQIALWERDVSSGSGKFLELSTMETLANLHQATLEMEGNIRMRSGHRQSSLSSRGFPPGVCTLRSDDGYVTFGGGSKAIWQQLCLMLDRLDLFENQEFQNVFANPESGISTDRVMERWMSGKTRQEVFIEASSVWMLPVSPVLKINEVLQNEQYIHRGSFRQIDHPVVGQATYTTLPFSVGGIKGQLTRAPLLGEHTGDFL